MKINKKSKFKKSKNNSIKLQIQAYQNTKYTVHAPITNMKIIQKEMNRQMVP